MAYLWRLIPTICSLTFIFLSLHPHYAISSSPSPSPSRSPSPSPSPSPETKLAADSPSNAPESPSPASGISSPPSPPPSQSPSPSPANPSLPPASDDDYPTSSLSPSPSPSPSPVPAVADKSAEVTDIHEQNENAGGDGMNGGKKAGVAIGVLVGACVVGLAGFVYKKRKDNIRRSQYGYAARSGMI